jgi:hypothetical protein
LCFGSLPLLTMYGSCFKDINLWVEPKMHSSVRGELLQTGGSKGITWCWRIYCGDVVLSRNCRPCSNCRVDTWFWSGQYDVFSGEAACDLGYRVRYKASTGSSAI